MVTALVFAVGVVIVLGVRLLAISEASVRRGSSRRESRLVGGFIFLRSLRAAAEGVAH